MSLCNRYVVGRERKVVHVDFDRKRDPPAPTFPAAAALRRTARNLRPARGPMAQAIHDEMRRDKALDGICGKRLTYRSLMEPTSIK
jgi:hypothetical protein